MVRDWLSQSHVKRVDIGWFWLDIIWRPSARVPIFKVSVLAVLFDAYHGKVTMVEFLSLQVLHFEIGFGWQDICMRGLW